MEKESPKEHYIDSDVVLKDYDKDGEAFTCTFGTTDVPFSPQKDNSRLRLIFDRRGSQYRILRTPETEALFKNLRPGDVVHIQVKNMTDLDAVITNVVSTQREKMPEKRKRTIDDQGVLHLSLDELLASDTDTAASDESLALKKELKVGDDGEMLHDDVNEAGEVLHHNEYTISSLRRLTDKFGDRTIILDLESETGGGGVFATNEYYNPDLYAVMADLKEGDRIVVEGLIGRPPNSLTRLSGKKPEKKVKPEKQNVIQRFTEWIIRLSKKTRK